MQAILGRAHLGGAQRWYLLAAMLLALALAAPAPASAQPPATGLNVIAVFYTLGGDRTDGGFRAMGGGTWEAHDGEGRATQRLTEVARSQSMVVLQIGDDGPYVHLDLAAQQVLFLPTLTDTPRVFADIVASQAGNVDYPETGAPGTGTASGTGGGTSGNSAPAVTGLTANEIVLTDDGVTPTERLQHQGNGVWIAFDRHGGNANQYAERSRSAEQIVLRDEVHGIDVIIDLTTMTLTANYVGSSSTIVSYRILSVHENTTGVTPAPTPAPNSPPAVTGLDAKEVILAIPGMPPLMKLVHVGGDAWVTASLDGQDVYGRLAERQRNAQRIALREDRLGFDFRIDFTTMTVSVTRSGQPGEKILEIRSASAVASVVPAASAPAQAVTGLDANEVTFSADGVLPSAKLVHTGNGNWLSVSPIGSEILGEFIEHSRDVKQIVLRDAEMRYEIVIDFATMTGAGGPVGQAPQITYPILSARTVASVVPGVATPTPAPAVTGLNANEVILSTDGVTPLLKVVHLGNRDWVTASLDGARVYGKLVEVQRDAQRILLHDENQDFDIVIDFAAMTASTGPSGQSAERTYKILTASTVASAVPAAPAPNTAPTPAPAPAPAPATSVTGLDANEVILSTDGVTPSTKLVHVGNGRWIAASLDERDVYATFVELRRDAQQIVLREVHQGLEVVIDFTTMVVSVGPSVQTADPAYHILSASTVASATQPAPAPAATGLNANEIVTTSDGVTPEGTLRHLGNGLWMEFNRDGVDVARYGERLRSAEQIVLRQDGSGFELTIDFTTMTVTAAYAGGNPLSRFRILSASEVASSGTPAPAPAPAQTSGEVNGENVTRVVFTGDGKTELGYFAALGSGQWAEFDVRGSINFRFVETGRDEWSVYLNDASRDVQIQLDLYTKQVLYGEDGKAVTPLYQILQAL